MSIVALSDIDHDGVSYHKGDVVPCSEDQANVLVEGNVAMRSNDAKAAEVKAEAPAAEAAVEPAPVSAPTNVTVKS
jgi:hypothetical protein